MKLDCLWEEAFIFFTWQIWEPFLDDLARMYYKFYLSVLLVEYAFYAFGSKAFEKS